MIFTFAKHRYKTCAQYHYRATNVKQHHLKRYF